MKPKKKICIKYGIQFFVDDQNFYFKHRCDRYWCDCDECIRRIPVGDIPFNIKYIKDKNKKTEEIVKLNKKIVNNLRRRLWDALRGSKKSAHTLELLGCSISRLKKHLESQFTEGMTWDNYGRKGWHIDHIRPCASFDFTKTKQQRICFHWTNLQPLWAHDNFVKSSVWDGKKYTYYTWVG